MLVLKYERDFSKEDMEDFLDTYYQKQKFVFLFDGLDQIRGTNYSDLAWSMFEIASGNPVLISSRPSSVILFENETGIAFLSL